jgi:hypothetical protein
MSNDNGFFNVSLDEYRRYVDVGRARWKFIKTAVGGAEYIRGIVRKSIYITDIDEVQPDQIATLSHIFESVRRYREESNRAATKKLSSQPMFFAEKRHVEQAKFFVPQVLSERREYVTAGLLESDVLVIAPHMQVIGGELFEFAILSSKMHHVWIATVCGRLKNDIRYSNSLGWNTFPLPPLTEKNKSDLSRCAAEILIAREDSFPATIAEMYDPGKMPTNLRDAHEQTDEVLERIYIGRRFRNSSERLEKLLDLYLKYLNKRGGELNE